MSKVIQFTGLSGAGKTTIARQLATELAKQHIRVFIVDGDEFRSRYSSDLGFSNADRLENISRMADYVNANKSDYELIVISAINPFNETRAILAEKCQAELIYIKCPIHTLVKRDTKGLYRRAMLPSNHPEHLANLTGVNQNFDEPSVDTFAIDTSLFTLKETVEKIAIEYFNIP